MEQELFDGDFFKALATLRLHINTAMSKGMVGSRKSTAKGNSLEFADFRDYVLGDDLRHIDWNAYGRTGKLLVKLFTEELEGRFHLFVDGSKSMDFGEESKAVCACRIAGALCSIILNNLDRVCLTTHQGDALTTSPGYTGRQSLPALLHQLVSAGFDSRLPVDRMVRSRQFYGRGVAVIISDFYLPEGLEGMLRYLNYHKQHAILIHVLAREELEPQLEGTLDLTDLESDDLLKISMTGDVLEQYRQALRDFTGRIRGECKRYGAGYLPAPSHTPIDRLLFDAFSASIL